MWISFIEICASLKILFNIMKFFYKTDKTVIKFEADSFKEMNLSQVKSVNLLDTLISKILQIGSLLSVIKWVISTL